MNATGDQQEDKDSLVEILAKLEDSYVSFCDDPGADEVADLSAWTREVFSLCSSLEDTYGVAFGRRLITAAWAEVK